MTELKEYVDALFRRQRLTPEIKDLKEEILSNMIAKRDDLMAQGMEKGMATKRAKESLLSVDDLIEGGQLTDIGKYHFDCSETALLHCIIYWILSMPLLYTSHAVFCDAGLYLTIILGINYLWKRTHPSGTTAFVSFTVCKRHERTTWIIWGLFFVLYAGLTAALSFGSDIWSGRPIDISGPWQIVNIAAGVYIPVIAIIVPITFRSFTKLLSRNKKEEEDEQEK